MKRLAGLIAFVAVLLLIVATALGADPASPAPDERAFQDPMVQEQIAAEQAREEERQAERSTPQAKEEREDSETAYSNASDAEALELAKDEFGEVLTEPLWRPLELEEGERIDAFLGPYTARVEDADGEAGLLESMLPLRARDDSGDKRPLDPELDEQGSHFEPENPIVETALPKDLSDGVSVEPADVSVRPAGDVAASGARPVENKVFYPNVATDTDFVAAPVATGVATFLQVRSQESPEKQELLFDMPAGSELRSTPDGGAEIASGGEALATVAPPAAWDADGESVPVRYAVEGARLTVEVDHREGDFRYPILVDPVIEYYRWSGLSSPGAYPGDRTSWSWTTNRSPDHFESSFENGLRSKNVLLDGRFNHTENPFEGSQTFNSGDYGEWLLESFRESYIERIDFLSMDHAPNGASACTTVGLYDVRSFRWETGRTYNPSTGEYASSPHSRCSGYANESRHHWVGQQSQPDGAGGDPEGANGNLGVFALVMDGSGKRTSVAKNLLRGSNVYRYDRNNPQITTAAPQSSGWLDDTQNGAPKTHSVTANGRDPGLGMKYFNLFGPGVDSASSDGSPDVQTKTHPCAGDRRARCPVDWQQTLSYKLAEGRNELSLAAYDVIYQSSPGQSWTQRIDRSAPTLDLSGSLKQNEGKTLREDSYELRMDARDGDASTKAQERSGMKRLEVFVDDEAEPSFTKSRDCPEGSCAMSETWELDSAEVGNGEHTIKVVATDQLGHTQTQSFDVTVDHEPGIGELRQYTFEDERLTDRSLLRTNVANGNLLYTADDLQVAGTGLNLGVSRFWNGLSERSSDFGSGWSMSTGADVRLEELDDDSVRFFGPSGYGVRFKDPTADGDEEVYDESPRGLDATLTKHSGGAYTLELLQSEEKYEFSDQGRLTEQRDKNGQKLRFEYGGDDRLDAITDTQERETRFFYNADGLIERIEDPTGQDWTYEYDAGNLVRYTAPTGTVTEYAYDDQDRLTEIADYRTDDEANRTKIDYEDVGRGVQAVTRAHTPDDENDEEPTTSFDYDTGADFCAEVDGKHTSTRVTDPLGNPTTQCVDKHDQVDKTRDALGNETERKYTSKGNVEEYSSQTGEPTTAEYDSSNRLMSSTGPGGSVTQFGYSGASDPGGENTSFRPNEATDPQGNLQSFQYDGSGNLTTVLDGEADNSESRKLIELKYNKDADDPDRDGTLKSSTDGEGKTTQYDYDGQGNLIAEIPPGSGESPPLQGTTRYEYDGLSRVDAVVDGNGERREIEYDALGRTTRVTYLNDPSDEDDDTYTRYAYDGAGNLTERADGDADGGVIGGSEETDRYEYDARNLTTKEELRDDRTNEYSYDKVGNLRTLSDAGGTTSYAYNALNLVSSITEPDRGPLGEPRAPFEFTYSKDQQVQRIEFPNGVIQENGYAKDRLVEMMAEGPTGEELTHLLYRYDKDREGPQAGDDAENDMTELRHQVKDVKRDITTNYEYDKLNRLQLSDNDGSTDDRFSYDYNEATNLVKSEKQAGDPATHYIYNDASELRCTFTGAEQGSCPADATHYDYDQNGNLLSVDDGNAYAYNERNQTTGITPPGADAIDFGYADVSQDERLRRGDTEFTDNLLGLGLEQNTLLRGDVATSSTFYTRGEQGKALGQRRPEGDYYYLADSLGSVIAMTDGEGNLAGRYRYDPYGQVVESSEQVPNAIRFAGEYYDSETKLYKMGVRYYDPAQARWTQKDPLNLFQDPRQGNRYAYAGGDPVNRADPGGRDFYDDASEFVDSADRALDLSEKVSYSFECLDSIGVYYSGQDPFGTGTDPSFGACDPLNYVLGEPEPAY